VVICTLFSILFMIVDARQNYLTVARQGLSVLVYPLQRLANAPFDAYDRVSDFFVTQTWLQSENARLTQLNLQSAGQTQRHQSLQAENDYLRRLLKARERYTDTAVMTEILHIGRDPFTRKVIVDRGEMHKIRDGLAVVDDTGVVGQVTKVYPFYSEVSLITDKDQAVPVEILRNGLRAVVFGQGQEGALDLPFMPANGDVVNGDVLVTSGIDGTYPPGLPVATVTKIERNAALAFAKITCLPSAGVARHKQMLVLVPSPATEAHPPPPPPPQREKSTVGGKHKKGRAHR
jgi:rod shape-determining protein MreC